MRRTILLVAMPGSIHVVRWIRQFGDQDFDIHLFPSTGGLVIHPELDDVIFHSPILPWAARIANGVSAGPFGIFRKYFRAGQREPLGAMPRQDPTTRDSRKAELTLTQQLRQLIRQCVLERLVPNYRSQRLVRVIDKIRPDIIHSLEIQAAGCLTLEAKRRFRGTFPLWLVTNWGSDIFLFSRMHMHKARIQEVLANCDYYSCECERDIELARTFGFRGRTMPVFPNTGGFNLTSLEEARNKTRPSMRRLIMLKGYQNWAGRSLAGLRALARCSDILAGYSIVIYLASPDVELAAELFSSATGVATRIVPHNTPHDEILALHGQARISIGLSISDAISTSFLEALVMGSFPIQSCTACADEWIEHGTTGMIVPPEDPDIIEMAIRTALQNDDLVDAAANVNWQTACDRLPQDLLRRRATEMYSSLLE